MIDLLAKIEEGVKVKEVTTFQQQYDLTNKQMSYLLAISPKGYYNLIHPAKGRLDKKLSGQFLKVKEVFQEGEEALLSKEAFLDWAQQPHWYFKQRKPFDLLDTPIGADAVINELGRTKYGMLS